MVIIIIIIISIQGCVTIEIYFYIYYKSVYMDLSIKTTIQDEEQTINLSFHSTDVDEDFDGSAFCLNSCQLGLNYHLLI